MSIADFFVPRYIRRLCRLLSPILLWYFRSRAHDLDRIPDGRAILVANHGGGMGPGDLVFFLCFCRKRGCDEPVYVLAHRIFMRLGPRNMLGRFGVVEASLGIVPRRVELRGGSSGWIGDLRDVGHVINVGVQGSVIAA